MKKIIKVSIGGLLAICVLAFSGFYIWSQQTYKPSEELASYVELDDIQREESWLVFEPEEKTKSGFILYPGAKVEPEAYSYYAQGLADKGYLVVVPRVNLNFALLDINEADLIREKFDTVADWYVGGHSLGGVAAASYAYEHLEEISGLVFLGSYPSNSSDFSKTDFPILSMYAEFDGLTTIDEIEDTKPLLSTNTTLYEVKGGNHAQFGMYGKQDGDGEATISAKEQQDELVGETVRWLSSTRLEK